jgi:ADP-ribose pyrophosphatase YjhB (NUDIX family)
VSGAAHRVLFLLAFRHLLVLLLGGLRLVVHVGSSRRPSIVAVVGELVGWRYCPRCRSELRGDDSRVECPECGLVSYASSKPTAGALCEDEEGRVLLTRRAHEPFRGRWDLPGGFLEEGEHPIDGIRRELREETGLEVEPLEFLGVWLDRYGGDSTAEATLNLYWTARVVGGEPQAADDVSELGWFAADELPPPDELAFENVPLVLSAWRARHEHA